MPQLEMMSALDYQSDVYKDAYSRINAIVIEGEEEAYCNYNQLAGLMPTDAEELQKLAKMEFRHKKGFAIAAYNIYIPVADDFARKITEGVVKDEYLHLNYGEEWLKANFATAREELETANKQNLPLVWTMLNQVAKDAIELGMEREALIEDFMIAYGEALANIGFTTRDIMRMSAYGLAAV